MHFAVILSVSEGSALPKGCKTEALRFAHNDVQSSTGSFSTASQTPILHAVGGKVEELEEDEEVAKTTVKKQAPAPYFLSHISYFREGGSLDDTG